MVLFPEVTLITCISMLGFGCTMSPLSLTEDGSNSESYVQ